MLVSDGDWGCCDWGLRLIEQICSGGVGGAGRMSGSPGGVRLDDGEAGESTKVVCHGSEVTVILGGAEDVVMRRRFSVDSVTDVRI